MRRGYGLFFLEMSNWSKVAAAHPMNSKAYVAFLRGINVGGNALIKMTELKKAFEALGFSKVTPVLASGNVIFESDNDLDLKQRIEAMLAKRFKIQATAIIRSAPDISALLKSNPFQNPKLSAPTKVQVTFLTEEKNQKAKYPIRIPAQDFEIMQVSSRELVSAVNLAGIARTPELMSFLEKNFGKNITTRTWNTIEKIAKLLERL